jgi:hypothetical protein
MYFVSFMGALGALCFVITSASIQRDKPFVSVIQTQTPTYPYVPYRRLIDFSSSVSDVVAFYIRVKHGSMRQIEEKNSWDVYLRDCVEAVDMDSEKNSSIVVGGKTDESSCVYHQAVTNITTYKTFSW